MNFEKYANSNLYHVFDKAFYLLAVNLVFVVISALGLGIFTLFPALAATYILIQCVIDDKNISILQGFYKLMKRDYIKLQILFIIILLLVGILIFNTMFFYEYAINQSGSMFHLISFFFFLSLDLFFIGLLFHIFPIYMYFNELKPLRIIKFSILMVFAYPFKTLFIVILFFGWILLILLQPPIIPFICITIPIYIYLKMFQTILKNLTNNEKTIANTYFY